MVNKIYIAPEATTTWTDSGGDAALDLGGLAADAVRVGARVDLGSGSRAEWYEWRILINGFDTAPVVGQHLGIYLATSDGTIEDGEVGTVDGAGATTDLPNLEQVGVATVQTITAANNLQTSGRIQIFARYVSPVIHNNTEDALLSTADVHKFILTPIPREIQ